MQKQVAFLTQSAMMLALATLLSFFAVFHLPNGGSVTLGSMIPLLFVAYKFDWKRSLLVAFAYSLIQMISGFYAPPTQNLLSFIAVVLLDYVIAFGALGLAGLFYRTLLKKLPQSVSMVTSGVMTYAIRFICHFFSGILIWSFYAPAGQPVWLYSLVYNGSYMALEALISAIFFGLAGPRLRNRFTAM